jgi:hypothetical protein
MTEQPKRKQVRSVDETEKCRKNEVEDDAEDGPQEEAQVGTAETNKRNARPSSSLSLLGCRRETLPFTPCP